MTTFYGSQRALDNAEQYGREDMALEIAQEEWEELIEGMVSELTHGEDAMTDEEAREMAEDEIGSFDNWCKNRMDSYDPY